MLSSSVIPSRLGWYIFGLCHCFLCFLFRKVSLAQRNLFIPCPTGDFIQVKHPEVAQFLGGRLYDCVFKYKEVSN